MASKCVGSCWRGVVRGENASQIRFTTECHLGFACLMLGKSSKNILPNGSLMVIYHGTK